MFPLFLVFQLSGRVGPIGTKSQPSQILFVEIGSPKEATK